MGQSSTMSNPMTFLASNTAFSKVSISYHESPPGSGVPTAGMIAGSNASQSMVMYTGVAQ